MKTWLSGIGSCCWWHSITSCWLHTFAPFFSFFPLIARSICHTIYTTFCLQCHVNCNCFKTAFTAYSLFKSRIFCSQKQAGKLKPFLRISRLEAVDTVFAFCGCQKSFFYPFLVTSLIFFNVFYVWKFIEVKRVTKRNVYVCVYKKIIWV